MVELSYWPASHCEALREFLIEGMTYRDAVHALNARFGTVYTRSAALGRGRRMGLSGVEPQESRPEPEEEPLRQVVRPRSDDFFLLKLLRSRPALSWHSGAPLRCVELIPRQLELAELEAGDCRYPYGGEEEGEAITFCGHRRKRGSSYCAPHFYLTRNPELPTERPPSATRRRLALGVESGGSE